MTSARVFPLPMHLYESLTQDAPINVESIARQLVDPVLAAASRTAQYGDDNPRQRARAAGPYRRPGRNISNRRSHPHLQMTSARYQEPYEFFEPPDTRGAYHDNLMLAFFPHMDRVRKQARRLTEEPECFRGRTLTDAQQQRLLDYLERVGGETLRRSVCCSITHDVFENPVVAEDGRTYDRAAIERWFMAKHSSPITNEPISRRLVPNLAMRQMIDEALQRSELEALQRSTGRGQERETSSASQEAL